MLRLWLEFISIFSTPLLTCSHTLSLSLLFLRYIIATSLSLSPIRGPTEELFVGLLFCQVGELTLNCLFNIWKWGSNFPCARVLEPSIFWGNASLGRPLSALIISPSALLKAKLQQSMAKVNGVVYSSANSPQHPKYIINQGSNHHRQGTRHLSLSTLSSKGFWPLGRKLNKFVGSRGFSLVCQSTETHNTETKERVRHFNDCSNISSSQSGDEHPIETGKSISSSQGLAEACRFVSNDAKFMNERAKNDIVLLSRSIMKLDARARQDVAFLGSEFLKLDARAKEDTEKIDHDVKKRAERLHHVAIFLKNIAQSRLKSAADKHWSDGALEADLKRADFVAKQRAMEDSLTALEFLKNIQDMMVSKMYRSKRDPTDASEARRHVTLEKNGKTHDFIPEEVSSDRINAIQEAYESMASALSEADGIDYTDPEELELLVAALIDFDAMDGKSSVSLLAECSSSPDVSTRRALANALSTAPSMWTLGNAGMGALQRLAEDSNPAIAAAASKTIFELKKQWEIEEGDSWRFMMNQMSEVDKKEGNDTEIE